MRSIAKLSVIAAAAMTLAASGTALAQPKAINVTLAPDFAEKAQKLGEREVEAQVADLTRTLERTLTRENALEGAVLDLVITDLTPNRPTMQQLTDRPGLDAMRSISIGGAAFEGTVTTADGTRHDVKYDYYSPTIQDAFGATVWTDAGRAYSRLANALASGRYVKR